MTGNALIFAPSTARKQVKQVTHVKKVMHVEYESSDSDAADPRARERERNIYII